MIISVTLLSRLSASTAALASRHARCAGQLVHPTVVEEKDPLRWTCWCQRLVAPLGLPSSPCQWRPRRTDIQAVSAGQQGWYFCNWPLTSSRIEVVVRPWLTLLVTLASWSVHIRSAGTWPPPLDDGTFTHIAISIPRQLVELGGRFTSSVAYLRFAAHRPNVRFCAACTELVAARPTNLGKWSFATCMEPLGR